MALVRTAVPSDCFAAGTSDAASGVCASAGRIRLRVAEAVRTARKKGEKRIRVKEFDTSTHQGTAHRSISERQAIDLRRGIYPANQNKEALAQKAFPAVWFDTYALFDCQKSSEFRNRASRSDLRDPG